MNYFITAIDTDSGKTFISAIVCEALGYSYWKPIQAGSPKDSDTIKALVPNVIIHPEQYYLNTPASPHAAAKIDGITIDPSTIKPPAKSGVVIEGAGGCLVPINDQSFIIDLVPQMNAEIILVADLYLGSINHTLLTVQLLKSRRLPVKGIIFNGPSNPESERIILLHAQYPCLLKISPEEKIDQAAVKKYAARLKDNWHE